MSSTPTTNGHGHDDHELTQSPQLQTQSGHLPGDALISAGTARLALAGLALGLLGGGWLGLATYRSGVTWRPLVPLVAGGPGVPMVIGAALFAALLALAGGLIGTVRDGRAARAAGPVAADRETHEPSGSGLAAMISRWLPVAGAIALSVTFLLTLVRLMSLAVGTGAPSSQANRMHWHQKNATRIGTADDRDTAALALETAYPATAAENAPRIVLRAPSDWRIALAGTPLVARPTDAAILVADDAEPGGARALVERLTSAAAIAVEEVAATDPAVLADEIDQRRASAVGAVSPVVLIVASDAEPEWAMPAGAYAARTGAAVLFVERDRVPAPTETALGRRGGGASMVVLGPERVVSPGVVEALARHGQVRRVPGEAPIDAAVAFGELRDERLDVGWGHDGDPRRQFASKATILVARDRWRDGIAAAHLARRGKAGPIVLVEGPRLPAPVDAHLWRLRPIFSDTPAEGAFNHVWVVGSLAAIPYGAQAWADYSQEIEQYMTLGPSAVSGFEALGIAWIALSIASAAWIAVNSWRRLPGVMPAMKAAWAIFALLLGPLALWLYLRSYHRRPRRVHEGMVTFERPPMDQTVSATVMMFGFDMMAMCLSVFALALVGFPVLPFDGPLFWTGTSMFLMMVFMFVSALVIVMLAFHGPMTQHEHHVGYRRALWLGLPIMAATMLVESLGMMPAMWWQQMYFLPAMQMPTEDDVTMWVTLYVAVAAGFLVVLPFNHVLVRRGHKMGSM
jgi:hypothetical protein